MLDKIRPPGASRDHLFIGTQRYQYFTLSWNPDTRQFDTSNVYGDLCVKHMIESQSRNRCSVDPSNQYLITELFEGVLNLVKIKPNKKNPEQFLETSEQIRITELRVISATFLHTDTTRPKYAMLYYAKRDEIRLVTYRVVDERGGFSQFNPKKDRENDIGDLCSGASFLIPVPKANADHKRYIVRNTAAAKAQLGGVIIVGETKMTYLDDDSKAIVACPLDEASIFVVWERLNHLEYLLGDEYGRLWLLTLIMDGAVVTNLDVRQIGITSKSTGMVHFQAGVVYVASHEGDNHVIRVNGSLGSAAFDVLQTLPNIAPVLDFAIMDMGSREGETQTNEYSSGQARLVTGSGVFGAGSLRSVRSGVGLEDVGIIADMEDVRAVFSLKSKATGTDDIVLVSLSTETRLFKFDASGEIEEVEYYRGLLLDAETLLAANQSDGHILQITPSCAILCNSNQRIAQWTPPDQQVITTAAADDSHALLAVNGQTLVSLDAKLNVVCAQTLSDDQIACVHVPQDLPGIGIVGFWKSGSVTILKLLGLERIHTETLRRNDNATIPRNIVLSHILPRDIHGPTLFVAMEDGVVLTFNVNKHDFSLTGRKAIVLGTQQARLEILQRSDGISNILATCEHPSLIYASEGKVIFSAVTAEDAICTCSFNNATYPNSIIVATSENLKISHIDTERRTHVKPLHLGKSVRRIAYSAKERAFGIGCILRDLINGKEHVHSTFQLVDEVVFGELGRSYDLTNLGQSEIIECVTRAELPIAYGDRRPVERFLVGTTYLGETADAVDNARGRLLIFGIDSSRSPYLIVSHSLKNACRQIRVMDGKIVAALVKSVIIYRYEEASENSASLWKLASYRPSICPVDISIRGDIVAVADLMKSVALVEYRAGKDGLPDTLREVARHYGAIQATAIVDIDEGTYLESDADGNLIVLRRNPGGVTLQDRRRMEMICEFSLGELVNRIRKIDVEPSKNSIVIPQAFLATTEGSIHLFATITPSYQDLLMRLQGKMSEHTRGHGLLDFDTYRAFRNHQREAEYPDRFVDGEFIERFLDMEEAIQAEICKGLGPSVEDTRSLVEKLKGLR